MVFRVLLSCFAGMSKIVKRSKMTFSGEEDVTSYEKALLKMVLLAWEQATNPKWYGALIF